ncbi:MAG TPA: molybdate ABC transporter substrate-binding protein [Rhodothermales bacterium]|nr:molybdate ABC transporter substrate-binding protein [Rhodothermales bacterium]
MRLLVRFSPFLLLLALILPGCGGERAVTHTVTVYAAASLTDALEAAVDSFEAVHPGYEVVLNPAASSTLARQIEQGAPADVFFSANLDWMDRLDSAGLVARPIRRPLSNRLVVVGPVDARPLSSVRDLLSYERIAMADPTAVPAGIYARQGLECLGLWQQVAPRAVPALDVRTALLSVESGAAGVGIVYASDLRVAAGVRRLASWPDSCRPDIRYAVAPVAGAKDLPAARRFIDFVTSHARDSLWLRFGFLPVHDSR